ncbi:MAG: hypothetical protein E7011_02010 [Alphaproteobacteria bacterium]|nr:hypothetical protein [Alphaproteobacteria bacterium]
MAEFFNEKDGAVGKEFWTLFDSLFRQRSTAISNFLQDPYRVQSFLRVAKNYSDIGGYLTDEQWEKVANYIMFNAEKVGTFNFYIEIFKLIFGDNADIEFNVSTPAPGVLEISIIYVGGGLVDRVSTDGELRIVDDGDKRVVPIINQIITIDNIRGLLSKIVPDGIFTKITIKTIAGNDNE